MKRPSNFCSVRKCLQNFNGRPSALARLSHAWFLVNVVFCEVLIAPKAHFVNAFPFNGNLRACVLENFIFYPFFIPKSRQFFVIAHCYSFSLAEDL